ncbi:glycoside hydrolase [Opitutaceae bacterium TAV5]|nr:glycoside hydrolase [Opitutaceae bacterium TAV5]
MLAGAQNRAESDGAAVVVHHEWERVDDNWMRCRAHVTNTGYADVALGDISLVSGGRLAGAFARWSRVFAQSNTMTGVVGIAPHPVNDTVVSDACMGWSDARGTTAMVAGFETPGDASYTIRSTMDERGGAGNDLVPEFVCKRDGAVLRAGERLEISPLLLGVGESLSSLLEDYARFVAHAMGAGTVTTREAGMMVRGWCSWYYFYGTESESDVLQNARALRSELFQKNSGLPEPSALAPVIQIDDGWTLPFNGHPRVWGDWLPGRKFPRGMAALVRDIHALGFRAGLWLAPFSVDKASRLAAEHPDWIVRAHNPETGLMDPAGPGHVFGLDLTHPAVLAWLRETFTRVFWEWGFDYVKIDFLIHGALSGRRHDPGVTPAEAFRRGLSVIREVADLRGEDSRWGRKFILCCGSPLGPAIGLCDGMRVGYDVGTRWHLPMSMADWPHGNCCIKAAAFPVLFRQWMHGRFWQNDPDCLVVRDHCTPPELAAFAQNRFVTAPVRAEEFGLDPEEAAFWARAVWMTGGMTFLSEAPDRLAKERRDLAKRVFQPHGQTVRGVDWYEDPEVCVLQSVSGQPMFGVFNMSDSGKRMKLPRRLLRCVASCYREWLTEELLEVAGTDDALSLPPLPPHAARIWMAV